MPKYLVTVSTTVWEEREVEVEAVDEEAAEDAAIARIYDPGLPPIPVEDTEVGEHAVKAGSSVCHVCFR